MSKQSSNADSHSEIQSDCDDAGYEEYCREIVKQRDACLQLLKSIDTSQGDRKNARKAIFEYCRTYGIAERTFWYYLVRYVEQQALNLDERPDAPFHVCDEYFREQIPSRIPRIPHRRCAQFKKLLCFTSSFLDRMNYLFDWLLNAFLEKAIKEDHVLIDDETLLDEELFFQCERIIINAIGVMQRSLVGHESDNEEF
jgi:hypothetical protein